MRHAHMAHKAIKWRIKKLPVILIVFQANQIRSCNRTFESRSFCQACAERNEDSRYENETEGKTCFHRRQHDPGKALPSKSPHAFLIFFYIMAKEVLSICLVVVQDVRK